LMNEVKNYFVTIQTPDNLSLEEVAKQQKTIKDWGLKVSENTKYIVSFVTGAIYDRSGVFAAFMEKIDQNPTRGIELGFQNNLLKYVTDAWKTSGFQSSPTWQRIVNLAKESWQNFYNEREELQALLEH